MLRLATALLLTLGQAGNDVLQMDDQCDSGDCSLELIHLRGQRQDHAIRLINHQIEDNKKYEVAVADDSAATCSPEGGAQITCAETHKCCTSKRSYLAGTAHESQPHLALYAICCPLDTHCKFDTIFVSCAPGAGPDDYSGVIAGLQYNQNAKAEMNQDAVALIKHQIEDNKKYEVAVADDSAATCSPEGGAQITCAETHKCCTSKRSYLAGTAHESQPHLALYAICCPLDTHCKFDTIFVSCAPGAGPDDYSGVIAG